MNSDWLPADELASRAAVSPSRVTDLTQRGLLVPGSDGRYAAGDTHRIRAVEAFERAGVPLEALADAHRAGTISLAYYDRLHVPPGPRSHRTYGEFARALGPNAAILPSLFRALALAQPGPESHLSADEEQLIASFSEMIVATGQPDLGLRVARIFADGLRRAADASLDVYVEALSRADNHLEGLPPAEQFNTMLAPWAEIARQVPAVVAWLAARHLSAAIDAYSVAATEDVLEASGYVPERLDRPDAVAFVDLTGFTRLSVERGDEVAAALALRFGELASASAERWGGRLVKLLGDGVLLRFPDPAAAVDGTLGLLGDLAAYDLPAGHAGIHAGPIISRDGDVFGRTVNLAARLSDQAKAGEVLVSQAVVDWIAEDAEAECIGTRRLQGIGDVPLFRIASDASARSSTVPDA